MKMPLQNRADNLIITENYSNVMTHASLFSGVGGAELAAAWMGWTNLFHCEINPFGCKVLEYWFPESKIYDDITKTDFTSWRGKVDVLTGGFPCQPFSLAGRRKGAEDNRYLWPEMLRAIREIQPTWVVGENVAGLVTMVQPGETVDMGRTDSLFDESHLYRTSQQFTIDAIIQSLEDIGYAVQTFVIPAVAVGAPHRRDRVWIVAHRTDARSENQSKRSEQPDTVGLAADTIDTGVRAPQHGSEREGQTQSCKRQNRPFGRAGRPCTKWTTANSDHATGGVVAKPTLQQYLKESLLPTPNAQDFKKRGPKSKQKSVENFIRDGHLLLSPMAQDGTIRGQMTMEHLKNHNKENSNLSEQIAHKIGGGNSHLSPLFVEEMMGYPLTWLVLPFLSQSGEMKQ